MIDKISFKLDKQYKNESEFTSRFGREIKKRSWFFHKISDADRRLKPFDAIFAIDWVVGAIEFKCTSNKKVYPYRMLRWSSEKNPWPQVKWLTDYQSNWWLSLVIVYNKKYVDYKVCDFLYMDFNSILTYA